MLPSLEKTQTVTRYIYFSVSYLAIDRIALSADSPFPSGCFLLSPNACTDASTVNTGFLDTIACGLLVWDDDIFSPAFNLLKSKGFIFMTTKLLCLFPTAYSVYWQTCGKIYKKYTPKCFTIVKIVYIYRSYEWLHDKNTASGNKKNSFWAGSFRSNSPITW